MACCAASRCGLPIDKAKVEIELTSGGDYLYGYLPGNKSAGRPAYLVLEFEDSRKADDVKTTVAVPKGSPSRCAPATRREAARAMISPAWSLRFPRMRLHVQFHEKSARFVGGAGLQR